MKTLDRRHRTLADDTTPVEPDERCRVVGCRRIVQGFVTVLLDDVEQRHRCYQCSQHCLWNAR